MASKVRERKLLLWRRDPHCHWCGVETQLAPDGSGRQFPTLATLDHLDNRLSGTRIENAYREERTVLACAQCNNERGKQACTQLYAEEHQRRSRGMVMSANPRVRRMGVQQP